MSIGASNAVVAWERSGSGSIAGANAPDPAGAQRAVGAERKATFAEVAALLNAEDSRKPAAANAAKPSSFKFWQNEDFGFGDLVDIINPLQHIPIVSTIYRNLTGDQIGPAPRVIGGALWGRVGGLVAGVVNTVVEWFTGKDIGDHIYAALVWRAQSGCRRDSGGAKQNTRRARRKQSGPGLIRERTKRFRGLPTNRWRHPRRSPKARLAKRPCSLPIRLPAPAVESPNATNATRGRFNCLDRGLGVAYFSESRSPSRSQRSIERAPLALYRIALLRWFKVQGSGFKVRAGRFSDTRSYFYAYGRANVGNRAENFEP